MEAPLCPLCGERHWARVCPKPKMATKERVQAIEKKPVKASEKSKAKKDQGREARVHENRQAQEGIQKMRPGSDYRGARRNNVRALGLNWPSLHREPGGKVRVPDDPHQLSIEAGKNRRTMAEQLKQPVERLFSVAIMRGDEILHFSEGKGSHAQLRGYQDPQPRDKEGFFTTGKRFVDRNEAKGIAIACGQLGIEWVNVRRDLLSSDIDWDGVS